VVPHYLAVPCILTFILIQGWSRIPTQTNSNIMHFSVFVSVILVLVSSLSTYAAPYGAPGTYLDIEQRSPAPLFEPLAERGQRLQPRADTTQHHASTQGHSSATQPETENAPPARQVFRTSRSFSASTSIGNDRCMDSPGLFGHWAVMVNGHYYELVFDRQVPNEASTSQSVQGQGIRLRVGNTPMPAAQHWQTPELQGTTTWTDEQIRAAADQLIHQMSQHSYNILTNNCHHFANSLIRCITGSRSRHCTVM